MHKIYFKTGAFDHSATRPDIKKISYSQAFASLLCNHPQWEAYAFAQPGVMRSLVLNDC
jgi:hypothetical protein